VPMSASLGLSAAVAVAVVLAAAAIPKAMNREAFRLPSATSASYPTCLPHQLLLLCRTSRPWLQR
jgi:hypothetical protein